MNEAPDNSMNQVVTGWVRRGARGTGGTKYTDDGPNDPSELAAYFLSLRLPQLASCWVACVVDAAVLGWEAGPMARALVVVAERLHGVKFPEPVEGVEPVGNSYIPASSPFSVQAQARRSGCAPVGAAKPPPPLNMARPAGIRLCRSEARWRDLLLASLPVVGDEGELTRLLLEIDPGVASMTLTRVRRWARAWAEFKCERRKIPGKRGPGTIFARRVTGGGVI